MKSLNDISKSILFTLAVILLGMFIYKQLFIPNNKVETITELMHKYKNYVIVNKEEVSNRYILTLKNPYIVDLIINYESVCVPSGVYYNFSVGDTIKYNKHIYFN